MTQLIYNGKNITDYIDIKKCVLHDCAGGGADDAEISFPDPDRIWGRWEPKQGDTVVVTAGKFSTGTMYVDRISQGSGIFSIEAISTPLSARRYRTRIWRNVRLSGIIADISGGHNLKPDMHGITDHPYAAISQINQTDMDFLNTVCKREGYGCKVTDGKLVVFNERYLESPEATITITPKDVGTDYEFNVSDSLLNSFTVQYAVPFGNVISYTSFANGITGGAGRKTEFLSTIAEAERWSKGYLRDANKHRITAWLSMKQIAEIAAGSLINVKGFGTFDGKYFIYKVTQDTVGNKTYLHIRQTISEY